MSTEDLDFSKNLDNVSALLINEPFITQLNKYLL